ncbi:MAG: hypothetical protein WC516_02665 [Patescibacteria group bacterium]
MPREDIFHRLEVEANNSSTPNLRGAGSVDDTKKILEEILSYSRAIYEDTQKMRRHERWRTIGNIIWIVLLVAPMVVALFWLPSLFSGITGNYQELLGSDNAAQPSNILNELKQLK